MADSTLKLDIGDVLHVEISFYNLAGALEDPTAVTFKVRDADGAITTGITVTNTAVGKYYADFPITAPSGVWTWRFEGVGGDAEAAEEQQFIVKKSAF